MKKFDSQEHQTILEDSDVDRIINTLLLLFTCAGIILVLFMVWVLFSTQIKNILSPARAGRVEIAVHNETQHAQIQKVHGAKNVRGVVYEADGKAYFYNQKGEKAFIK